MNDDVLNDIEFDLPGVHNFQTEDAVNTVQKLARLGLTQEHMANFFGVSKRCFCEWLVKHPPLYAALKKGKSDAIAFVSGKLFENITEGKEASIFFYLKTQAGWREKTPEEIKEEKPTAPTTFNVANPADALKIYQEIMNGGK